MINKKPRGYFKHVLAVDVETSGMCYGTDDPSYNPKTGETYQIVSIGLVVADVATFKPVEELYLEIKWDGESVWSKEAEGVHGLTKQYLEEHGVDRVTAVEEIGNLVIKYWGPDTPICLLGHNVATFDLWFFKRLMRSEGIHLRFGNRYIDSQSAGIATFGTFNSDDLFAAAGFPERDPSKHNALDDAKMALTSVRLIKQLWNELVTPEL
jgi:hypothetical protein